MVKKLGSLKTKETAIQFHVNGSLCTGNMLEYHNSKDYKLKQPIDWNLIILQNILIIVEPGDVPVTLSLARYIRDYRELTGTKVSCNQSGCGACTVTAEIPDQDGSNNMRIKSVNSVRNTYRIFVSV